MTPLVVVTVFVPVRGEGGEEGKRNLMGKGWEKLELQSRIVILNPKFVSINYNKTFLSKML